MSGLSVRLESIVRPMAWEDCRRSARPKAIRTPGTGEDMVLDQNLFVRGPEQAPLSVGATARPTNRAPSTPDCGF
jgi:hypothetical protein